MKIEEKIKMVMKVWKNVPENKTEKFHKLVLKTLQNSKDLSELNCEANSFPFVSSFYNRLAGYIGSAGVNFEFVKLALKQNWEDVLCVLLKATPVMGQLYFVNEGGYVSTILHEAAMMKMDKLCLLALEINPKLSELEDEFGNTFVRCAKIAGLENVVEKAAQINPIYGKSAENQYVIRDWKRKMKPKSNSNKYIEKSINFC